MTTTPARKPMMAGNWKMHLNHLEAVAHVQRMAFALKDEDYDHVEVVVLPPFTDLRSIQVLTDADRLKITYGAQDVSRHEKGAYTGQVSAAMLAKLGCTYTIVGHSERRQYQGETNENVHDKAKQLLRQNITPIMCFGEPLAVREKDEQVRHVLDQVAHGLMDFEGEQVARMVLAYEPIWAIGTGLTASPSDAQEVCQAVREWVAGRFSDDVAQGIRILYGGSMKASNVASLMAQPDVDGGLVGGAALDPDEFVTMVRYRLLPVE
jgi:triosephosphate isomerase (TIM)